MDRFCAWVDANDAFDPESAAANGLALRQLLWVRCGDGSAADCAAWAGLPLRRPGSGRNPGRASTRHCTPPTCCCRRADLPPSFWILADCAGARQPDSIRHMVSLSAGGGPCAVQPGSAGQNRLRAVQRGGGAGVRAHARQDRRRNVVLRGFSLAVHRERERFTAMPPETRKPTGPPTTDLCGWGGKPPASTWTASAAWDAENRGPHGQILVRGVKKSA